MQSIEIIKKNLAAAKSALVALEQNDSCLNKIAQAGELMATTLKAGNKIISCGNGGSMCDAMHFAEELSGRFQENRRAFSAIAISDPGYLSCVANDFGYENVFSRFLEAHAKKDDILLAISTSGQSKNVLNALTAARKLGMKIIALTGRENCPMSQHVDIEICTQAATLYADRVQELHIKVIHSLIEMIENICSK